MKPPFEPRDFPHSEWVAKQTHRTTERFPRWSAREANRNWQRARRQIPFLSSLEETARTRNGLERHVLGWRAYLNGLWARRGGRSGPLQFGWPRKTTEHTLIGNWGNAYFYSHLSGPLHTTVVRKLLQRKFPIETTFSKHRVWAEDITVQLRQSGSICASRLFEGREGDFFGTLGIYHPEPPTIEKLLEDLEVQLRSPNPHSISRAVWDYFQAMPYERGSSSIGQAVWAGWLSAHFERKVRLPDGVDLFAMIQERDPFVDWLVPQLTSETPLVSL